MKKSLLFLSILAMGTMHAQDMTAPFQLSEISIAFGGIGDNQTQFNLNDAKDLAPESMILEKDLSGYDFNKFGRGYDNGFSMSALLGFSKPQEKNALGLSSTFRVGINYERRNNLAFTYYKEDSFVVDTLVSSQTGEETYVDSVSYHNLNVSNDGEFIGLDVSYVLSSNRSNKWSFSMGVGLIGRVGFNNYTNIEYSVYNPNYDFHEDDSQYSENESEVYFHNSGSSFTGYLPVQINYRLSKRKAFWDQCSVMMEVRPSITYRSFQDLDSYVNSEVPFLFGLRYSVFSLDNLE